MVFFEVWVNFNHHTQHHSPDHSNPHLVLPDPGFALSLVYRSHDLVCAFRLCRCASLQNQLQN